MKKIVLFGSALLLAATMANAQTAGWSASGGFDDFSTATDYSGMSWGVDATQFATPVRDNTNYQLVISPKNATVGGNTRYTGGGAPTTAVYPSFNCQLDQMDLSSYADIEIDVENTSSVWLVMKIELHDANDHFSDIEPDISDVLPASDWSQSVNSENKPPRKANNGFVLDPTVNNGRATYHIDLSSVAGAIGGLQRVGYVGFNDSDGSPNPCNTNGPYCAPITDYTLDPTKITNVIFTVNWGGDDHYWMSMGDGDPLSDFDIDIPGIQANVGPLDGDIIIHSFKIGNAAVTSVTDATVNNSLKAYPNPAKDQLNVSFDATAGAQITLSELNGHQVYSSAVGAGTNNVTLNTSGYAPGMYVLNVATQNGNSTRKISIQ